IFSNPCNHKEPINHKTTDSEIATTLDIQANNKTLFICLYPTVIPGDTEELALALNGKKKKLKRLRRDARHIVALLHCVRMERKQRSCNETC
ncbi:hypothetical protein EZS27_039486, partial [termite gut metagenome]